MRATPQELQYKLQRFFTKSGPPPLEELPDLRDV